MAKNGRGVRRVNADTYCIDYQVNGTRRQQWIKASSLKEARAIRDEYIVNLRKQLTTPQSEQLRFQAPFDEVWGKLHADIVSDGLTHKSIGRCKITFKRLFKDFREAKHPNIQNISEITIPYFQEYKAYFINDLGHDSKGGWRDELIHTKAMMNRIKKLGYCRKDIIEDLRDMKRPRAPKKGYPDIPDSKLKSVLDFIKQDRPDYYYPIYFMCRTGRRIMETISIQKKDVIWNGLNPVRIDIKAETTKTGDYAPLKKLDEGLQRIVREAYRMNKRRKTVYLFANRLQNRCHPNRVREYLKRVSKEIIGITITPHYFRHRFFTECGKANVSMVDIMEISGLRDIGVLIKHYSHSTETGKDKVFAASKV